MSKRQWKNLWLTYRVLRRTTGSIAVSLVAIDEYSPAEAQLLARIVF